MFSLVLGNYHSAGGLERCTRRLLLKGVMNVLEGEIVMFGFECSEPRLILLQQEKYRNIKNPPSNCDFPYTKLLVCALSAMRVTNSRRRNQFSGNLSQVLTPFKFGQQTMTIKIAALQGTEDHLTPSHARFNKCYYRHVVPQEPSNGTD
ncbi:hypothetical protein CDAR_274881 [Caerostris darwini]|uniref:Uncharacterized protein n=1 Tax=Caerostris darwini TaxID=1538125 RepID=A0AAV4PH07_9ARAC|nr:hypothetical protein CDAR_274881 [Caerostris darwini]